MTHEGLGDEEEILLLKLQVRQKNRLDFFTDCPSAEYLQHLDKRV